MQPESSQTECPSAFEPPREIVILLHGLARSSNSMAKMAKSLSRKGYMVFNLEYPSTRLSVEEIAERYLHPIVCRTNRNHRTIHFVTHSMGGIVVRHYLKHYRCGQLGRIVMLAPPNQGSELVDFLKETYLFKKILGPAGQQLSTAEEALPNQLGPADFELGIITGNISFNPLSLWVLKGPDDGKVAVKRAALPGMREMLVVPCNHTFIMQSSKVIARTAAFLKSGRFYEMMENKQPLHFAYQPQGNGRSISTTNQGNR